MSSKSEITSRMAKDQLKDLAHRGGASSKDDNPRNGASPGQVPVMRRSRSLSELPGSVRVPILKRADNERMKARLEAGVQGLQELKLLREQQQKQMDEVRSTALQKNAHTVRISQSQPQLNQRRTSSASLRLSSASLASICEEGDDSGRGSCELRDRSNFRNSENQDRRHSHFGGEVIRNRRPLSRSDIDVLENELSTDVFEKEPRQASSWGSLPSGYNFRSVSSENIQESDNESLPEHSSNVRNYRRNQRSQSFSAIPSTGDIYMPRQQFVNGDVHVNSENIQPKLRRASIQCEAVLTGGRESRANGIFKDVDLSHMSKDKPGPLHAVLAGFKRIPSQTNGRDPLTSTNGSGPDISHKSQIMANGSHTDPMTHSAVQRRNSFHSEPRLHPSSDNRVHSRRLSEVDTNVSNMSQMNSVPINDLADTKSMLKQYMKRCQSGGSSDWKQSENRRPQQTAMTRDFRGPETSTTSLRDQSHRGDDGSRVKQTFSENGSPARADTKGRRDSNGNHVCVDNSSRERTPDNIAYRGNVHSPNNNRDARPNQLRKGNTNGNDIRRASTGNDQTLPVNGDLVIYEVDNSPEKSLSPSQFTSHEKKYSIASDEGYVTSPPSTPRGRHAHSIVSDGSWISTDMDDTASSCEPSPDHGPRDIGHRSLPLHLKRNDLCQDYSKAKLSKRSPDHRTQSVLVAGAEKDLVKTCDEPIQEDSCTSNDPDKDGQDAMPFRQTAV